MPDLAAETDGIAGRVAAALAAGEPLEVTGAGTKRGFGRPVQAARSLDLAPCSGIVLHEPEELVLRAGAATPLAEIEARLAAAGQHLAFEPPEFGPLWGGESGRQTIGGIVATNLSGPRRIAGGAVRDHLLGFRAVTGRGEAVRGGSRVMKNVTGFDLPKLACGSFGTLMALTEVTLKVLPAPETTRTVLVRGLADAAAVSVLAQGLGSPHDVTGAAHLPAAVALRSRIPEIARAAAPVTALRIEGGPASVEVRVAALTHEIGRLGWVAQLDHAAACLLWTEIRDVAPLFGVPLFCNGLEDEGKLVWRLSVPPTLAPAVVADIERGLPAEDAPEWFYDWGGGLVWLAIEPSDDAASGVVRGAIRDICHGKGGGHATLMRAPASLRRAVPVFEPRPAPLAALEARVKAAFDPAGIFNPGRMTAMS